ncbi:Ig-like domain-containing protein [Pelagicoccus sp. SDUM812003]|uniref:Ig-like domain-containing protein n=1 Tax=Pelagicoccus sp. SDUM812003 TaxID=3041267 RepID=UPI002811907D|nr:Ig-like domain-containing protein [Pelagicoccus sp. SDUM812003]
MQIVSLKLLSLRRKSGDSLARCSARLGLDLTCRLGAAFAAFAVAWVAMPFGMAVDVTLDFGVRRDVGTSSEFDRSKFMVLHANIAEQGLRGEKEKVEYLLNELDLYLGRDNGSIVWYYNQSRQDPDRAGFVDPGFMMEEGERVRREVYGKELEYWHQFESRADVMIGAQYTPFWPGSFTQPATGEGWGPTTAESTGEYMGRFISEFYREPGEPTSEGQPPPRLVEVMNEPLYHFVDEGEETPLEVFEFHNTVAAEIRKFAPEALIGGYTVAFPYYDIEGFQRWRDRDKLFVDVAGANMDFFSLHFYDFDQHWVQGQGYVGPWNFKGGRVEATLDMLEQYSWLALGEVKPMVISEYGSRDHELEQQEWSRERDWIFLKSFTPLMMAFMDRSDRVLKAIPFMLMKAEWSETVYDWRLMRKANELEGQSGEHYVFTDLVKFFELWSEVKGQRALVKDSDPDVKSDLYIDGYKAFLILSNLAPEPKTVDLQLKGLGSSNLVKVRLKHLHAVEGIATLVDEEHDVAFSAFELGSEASAIIEYTLSEPVEPRVTVQERLYYANDYLREIEANAPIRFQYHGVELSDHGYATIRIGIGREHGKSLRPSVRFNGVDLRAPLNLQGDDQSSRFGFFGLIEVSVPYPLIRQSNEVEIAFPDQGGHVSSATLLVGKADGLVGNQAEAPEVSSVQLIGRDLRIDVSAATPGGVYGVVSAPDIVLPRREWSVDPQRVLMDESGSGFLERSIEQERLFLSFFECPECLPPAGPPESVQITKNRPMTLVGMEEPLSATVEPTNALDREIEWHSKSPEIARVSAAGVVSGVSSGTAQITATAVLGGAFDTTSVVVAEPVAQPGLAFDDVVAYQEGVYKVGYDLDVSCQFFAGKGDSVDASLGGVRFLLREVTSEWAVVSDVVAVDTSAVGVERGVASASLSLEGLAPSSELPEGNFYFLFVNFETSGGESFDAGVSPILVER